MAPLYRHLAHPVEGILNNAGEGVPQQPTPSTTGAANRPVITSNMLAGRKLPQKIDFPWDEKLYESLREDNKKELEQYQKEEEEAAEAAGDTEVLAAQGKRAEFWARVGDKVRKLPRCSLQRILANGDMPFRTRRFDHTKPCWRRRASWGRRSIWFWR